MRRAKAAGVEIIGDIELFCRERAKSAPGAPFVAVTGTNGKSTTTALVAHILKAAGRDVAMGGNIGTAVLALDPPAPQRCHVIEMSSFQIELTPTLRPTAGILLNITPDHLDRHGTMENYAGLKERLVQGAEHPIVGDDDAWCRAISERLGRAGGGWVDILSARARVPQGWFAEGSSLFSQAPWTGPAGRFADLAGIGALRGQHNIQNALAAAAAAMRLGVSAAEVAAALATFPGLAHRLEEIGRLGGILFINDSKATNADSAATALAAFEGDVLWILGGRAKRAASPRSRPSFPASPGPISSARPPRRSPRPSTAGCNTSAAARSTARLPPQRAMLRRAALRRPWCCSRPPARPTTSTATSRSVATPSALSSPPCRASNAERRWRRPLATTAVRWHPGSKRVGENETPSRVGWHPGISRQRNEIRHPGSRGMTGALGPG